MKKLALLILPITAILLASCDKKEDTKKIEHCIEQICEKVVYDGEKIYLLTTLNVHFNNRTSVRIYSDYPVEIPAEEAIKISKNWDIKNMRLYTNTDGEVKDYEKDACETLNKLNLYISSNDLEIIHQYED